ncbi:MAG: hypothetical protein HYW50_00310 [Candidatus Diapherotrites archaeon]|nr:hypothetical protein [Candidatus Diapherotrites archaeon]
MSESFPQNIVVIADSDTCTGFRLAGIKEAFAVHGREAEKKLEEIIEQQKTGIVIVNEKMFSQIDWRLRKKIEHTAKPVIIVVPDKSGPSTETESLKSLITKALGLKL